MLSQKRYNSDLKCRKPNVLARDQVSLSLYWFLLELG